MSDEREPTQLDRMAPVVRAREEGWRDGMIEGALSVLASVTRAVAGAKTGDTVVIDLRGELRELIRRWGSADVDRRVRLHPQLRAMFDVAVTEIASADTQPIDMASLHAGDSNSPRGIGGTGEPGGLTGGLTHPTETTKRRRTRREDGNR